MKTTKKMIMLLVCCALFILCFYGAQALNETNGLTSIGNYTFPNLLDLPPTHGGWGFQVKGNDVFLKTVTVDTAGWVNNSPSVAPNQAHIYGTDCNGTADGAIMSVTISPINTTGVPRVEFNQVLRHDTCYFVSFEANSFPFQATLYDNISSTIDGTLVIWDSETQPNTISRSVFNTMDMQLYVLPNIAFVSPTDNGTVQRNYIQMKPEINNVDALVTPSKAVLPEPDLLRRWIRACRWPAAPLRRAPVRH